MPEISLKMPIIEIKEVYEARGGDDILHDKLEPEVMSLVVKD